MLSIGQPDVPLPPANSHWACLNSFHSAGGERGNLNSTPPVCPTCAPKKFEDLCTHLLWKICWICCQNFSDKEACDFLFTCNSFAFPSFCYVSTMLHSFAILSFLAMWQFNALWICHMCCFAKCR